MSVGNRNVETGGDVGVGVVVAAVVVAGDVGGRGKRGGGYGAEMKSQLKDDVSANDCYDGGGGDGLLGHEHVGPMTLGDEMKRGMKMVLL